MHEIHLNENLYQQASRRAVDLGFNGVDDYVADMLRHDLEEPKNFDRLFTPERMEHIEQARKQADAGQVYPAEQVWENFDHKRDA
jgi:hypothetical protein